MQSAQHSIHIAIVLHLSSLVSSILGQQATLKRGGAGIESEYTSVDNRKGEIEQGPLKRVQYTGSEKVVWNDVSTGFCHESMAQMSEAAVMAHHMPAQLGPEPGGWRHWHTPRATRCNTGW